MNPSLEHRYATSIHLADLCKSADMLDRPDNLGALLGDLCTPQELKMLCERWAIAKLMHMGFSYRIIQQKTGASSATIARVSHNLSRGNGALLEVCRMREEVFARQHEAENNQAL